MRHEPPFELTICEDFDDFQCPYVEAGEDCAGFWQSFDEFLRPCEFVVDSSGFAVSVQSSYERYSNGPGVQWQVRVETGGTTPWDMTYYVCQECHRQLLRLLPHVIQEAFHLVAP